MPNQVLNRVNTTTVDTTHADTPQHVYYAPRFEHGFNTPIVDTIAPQQPPAMAHIEPPETVTPDAAAHALVHNSPTMATLLAAVILIMVSYRSGYKYIENFFHNMFSIRRRESLFANRTVNETRVLSALIFLTCVCEGILTYFGIRHLQPDLAAPMQASPGKYVLALSAAALLFYLVQLALFRLLGYIFSDKVSTKLWLDGFKASQSLLGLLLFPVVALLLVFPAFGKSLLIIGVALYFSARIVFLSKGFRIFYSNLLSHVYFLLYLCGVEIVPLVLLWAGAFILCYQL